MNDDANNRDNGKNGDTEDPLEKRPGGDTGDTAVPQEGDVAQQSQTVEDDFTPPS